MENFDAVWERVSGAASVTVQRTEGGSDDRASLRAFMDDEHAAYHLYACLAAKCPAYSRTLMCMAADEKSHLRRHQLEYFLLYGDNYLPAPARPSPRGTLAALREAFLDENAASEAYLKAANETGNGSLAENYREIASIEADHAAKLRALIGRAL